MEDPELTRKLAQIQSEAKRERNQERTLRFSWLFLALSLAGLAACLAFLNKAFLLYTAYKSHLDEKRSIAIAIGALVIGAAVFLLATVFFAGRISRILAGVPWKRKEP